MKNKLGLRFWGRWLLAAFLLLLFWNGVLEARVVAYSEAWLSSARLLEMENSRPDLRLTQGTFRLDGIEPLIYRDQPVAYLVKLKPQGFMILSDITEVSPQVFISFSGDFTSLREHPFLTRILDHLEYDKAHLSYLARRESQRVDQKPGEAPDRIQVERNESSWSSLLNGSVPAIGLSADFLQTAAVAPMLTCEWNQNSPYNNYTPLVSGQPTYAGCSAIAMAQVMYFWRNPDQGQGSHSYKWKGQTLKANFNHPYYWDRMLSDYSGSYTGAQADAVARLISDVGIAIDMDYEVSGSGSVANANNAFFNFFKYSHDVRYKFRSQAGNWAAYFNVIKQQIDLRQPAIMAIFKPGSGHAVVADGYRTSPSNELHVNMGWGGANDNYYSVDNIYGYGDAAEDYAVLDIHPTQLSLTLQATAGGTTHPAPGTYKYSYGKGIIVQVTALPKTSFEFLGWSGGASGTQNPININVDAEISVTANFGPIIYAPTNAAGQKVLNRSLSQAEYINVITFGANPNNVNIQGYRIYLMANGTRTLVASLDSNTFKYLHRGVVKNQKYTYEIVAVNNEPREGDPAVVVIQ